MSKLIVIIIVLLSNNAIASLSIGKPSSVSVLSSPLRGDKRGASYPNPANTVVYINAKDYEYITLKLFNVMGELVAEQLMDNTSIGLDISKLSNGIYVYKAYYNGTEQKTGKLIITK